MKVWILTLPRESTLLFPSEELMNADIVRLAKQGKIIGKIVVTTADLDVPVNHEPGDDYLVDGQGRQWDYFPSMNQYRRVLDGDTRYSDRDGFKSQEWIYNTLGIRVLVSNGIRRVLSGS